MKILIDANIAIDVLLERQPFCNSAVKILSLSKGGIDLFISASAVTDLFYIINRQIKDKKATIGLIKNLLENVAIAAVSNNEIYHAIDLDWDDFEDAVQYAAGEAISIDYLITRNKKDFLTAALPVVTPDEFLKIIIDT